MNSAIARSGSLVLAFDVLNMRAFPSAQSRVIHRLGRHECDIAFLPYAVGSWQKIRADALTKAGFDPVQTTW